MILFYFYFFLLCSSITDIYRRPSEFRRPPFRVQTPALHPSPVPKPIAKAAMTTHFLLLLAALLINSICKASTIAKVILLIVVVVALLLLLFAVLYESHHAREVGKKVLIHAVNACLGYFAGYYHQSVSTTFYTPFFLLLFFFVFSLRFWSSFWQYFLFVLNRWRSCRCRHHHPLRKLLSRRAWRSLTGCVCLMPSEFLALWLF